jgi:Ca-activated chloride channel family protein
MAGIEASRRPDLWLTPDQRGDRLLRHGQFEAAATTYQDPLRQGVAWYRAGKFKEAAATFARVGSPEGAFNRGNALVLLGKYDDAIRSYDRALSLRPGWREAEDNRALARERKKRLDTTGGDMTGGRVKPDQIVFDKPAEKREGEETEVAEGAPLTDEQLRALWLRRIQTKPADFLRAKFAFQEQRRTAGSQP